MQQIADWLEKLGMSQYAERFAENGIDVSVLRNLTDQDLRDIGVLLGHRRKMLGAIAELTVGPASEAAAAPTPKPQDGAERRQLTVMFCDLVGSTALSSRLDPEDLRDVLAAYHRCCTELVECNGGFVAKYMGDGVLAYFGYPQAHEHDAERAVRAGLALAGAVPKLETNVVSPLKVRIGIASGLVVVGDLIGTGVAQERAVVGETPNLAARLQALAEAGTVVIALSTRRLTGGLFEYRDLGAVALKGFDNSVPAFQVIGADAAESRFEALRTAYTPLVGRDEEIDLLMRRWGQAKAGDGCVVLLSGDPGIGKSRIAQTMLEQLAREPHTRLRYFCSPHHQDSALYPSITQLERAAGFRRGDTEEQRLNKLEAVLAQGTNDLSEAVPLLAELLSIPSGGRYPSLNLSPRKRRERTLHAQLTQVEGLAAHNPVLMVWEDVHWSDPTTREFLNLLIERVVAFRVLVIITFRPEFTPPWIGRPHVTMLTLNRLLARQHGEMIAHAIAGKRLPKEIANQIIERADGVPLFLEELTKTVVESGILTEAGDHYTVAGPAAPLSIPTSLHASLLARLDRLAPTREVAQTGAALGRSFSHELICAVAEMPHHQVDDALAQLVRAELMFRRGTPPDAEYTFKHALLQDAAYSTLLRSRRQQLHTRIVSTLENQFSEVVAAQPQLMARHCVEARLNDKAIDYWLKGGQQAVARSAMTEAVVQLQKGLNLLSSLPKGPLHQQQELDLRSALGKALMVTRGFAAPEVRENMARARALAEQLDRPNYLIRLLHGQFLFHLIRAELKPALLHAEQTEKIGEVRNDPYMLLMGRIFRGVIRVAFGEFVAARTLFEQCLCDEGFQIRSDAAYRAVDGPQLPEDEHAVTHGHLAQTLAFLGHIDQARTRANQALSEAHRLQHADVLAFVLFSACRVEWVAGSPHDVQRYAEQAVALSSQHDFAFWLSYATIYRLWSLTALGQAQEGVALLAKGLSAGRDTGAVVNVPEALMMLAGAYAQLGRSIEGLDCLTEATQIIRTTDARCVEAESYRLRGDLLNGTGDRAAAEQNYRLALAVAERQNAKTFELRAATSLARLWREQGKRAKACNLLAPIYGWFTEGFDTPVVQDAKALLDQLA